MKNIIKILSVVVSLWVLSGCIKLPVKTQDKDSELGKLAFTLESEQKQEAYTQAKTNATEYVPNLDFYDVEILNSEGEIVQNWENYKDVPTSILLSRGKYTLFVYSDTIPYAIFDYPVYQAKHQFVIEPKILSEVNAACKLASAKVSVVFDQKFIKEFNDDFSVTITNGKGALVFGKSEDRTAYFAPSRLVATLKATRKSDGSPYLHVMDLKNSQGGVQGADFFKIKLSVDDPRGTLNKPNIIVDLSVNERDLTIEVPTAPGENPNPDPEPEPDPDPTPDAASVTLKDKDISQPVVFPKGTDPGEVVIQVNAPNGIEQFRVRIESNILTAESLEGLLDSVDFDLANLTPELEGQLSGLGLIQSGVPIKGENKVDFDLTDFMPLIGSLEPNEPEEEPKDPNQTHYFHIEVKEKGSSEIISGTLTVIVTE